MAGGAIYFFIASMAASAYSAYESNRQAGIQAKSESAWQQYNAQCAQREADAEAAASKFEQQKATREAKQLRARQAAAYGQSGVQMVGSPLLVAVDTARQQALELANIRSTGQRRVSAYKSQSLLSLSKASAASQRASAYNTAAYTSAGSSILGGVVAGHEKGYWDLNQLGKKKE